MTETATTLRPVYTVQQFAAEVLGGNRGPVWVRRQCARRRISVVARRPYLIPQSEAVRFINPAN